MMQKKDTIKIILLVVLAVVSSIVIYNNFNNNDNNKKDNKKENINLTEDEKKFKKEYEDLNSNKDIVQVSIEEDNGMIYASYDKIHEILTKGTGVIYFGFPECPWCRNALPMLLQAASNQGLDEIYYFNARDIRDTKSLDENGNIITEKEGTKEYYELIEIMKDHLGEYEGLNDESIKRLYFPTVVFVKDGKILGIHVATVDSQTNPKIPLNEKQKEELVNIYMNYISKVLGNVCDDKC